MSKVVADISVSLDGFIAGPNDGPGNPLGDRGERLHEWAYPLESWRGMHGLDGGATGPDSEVMEEAVLRAGAYVMGRRMFDLGEGPWGDTPPFHAPVFVVTHEEREPLVKPGGTTFTFVTGGIEEAVGRARRAAGEKDVVLAGGGQVIRGVLAAGLLDELQMHVVPVLLGGGVRLFEEAGGVTEAVEFETTRVIDSPAVTHLRLRPARD
ncbi:dihydrofolate reductase [Streptomyces sp. ISL-10]|uniref:dihydrofolate reductase family protein n=1 Tax=Streptomyces sp. ISL-10 TaxID=2819172 RepID=UPI001BE9D918|nr:dihydrofolate reductase family protein [Streptomyces sp. ISL-10]MBT2364951.1 dihydrofolate reductase [Streptomyces sp. ISL-10]